MKKDFRRIVEIGNHRIEVTKGTPEVYRITLVYDDGYVEEFYRSFYDEDDAERYCLRVKGEVNNVFDCKGAVNIVVDCFYNYSFTVVFDGGNEVTVNFDGGNKDEE